MTKRTPTTPAREDVFAAPVGALAEDTGLTALLEWLLGVCSINGCHEQTTRRGQPCHDCMKEMGCG
jgi:hypothetical protein